MNKKISTLMASLLFASAFTVSAANPPVEGDNVRLTFNSKYATIGKTTGFGVLDGATAPDASANENKGNFEEVNRQIWKIAKLSKSSTGQEVYQFVNKWTGEYLAIKLVSAPDEKAAEGAPSVSKKAAKLDPTGNKEWAIKDGKLWAYDSATDSTYYLNDAMQLVAEKGNDHSGSTGFAINTIDGVNMPLTAGTFNALMGLPGNNAKLNFNNGKDVTSTQTNQLKNVKWVADENGTDALYLTNGATTEGHKVATSAAGETWSKIQKKMYLQVDTAYYDTKTPNYFKFDVDTINYELKDDDYAGKPIAKHPNQLAQFAATYYFGNDSIAISAKYLPKKAVTPGAGGASATFEGVAGNDLAAQKAAVVSAFTAAMNNISKSVDVNSAYTSLKTAVDAFAPGADKKFSEAVATNAALIDELATALSADGEFAWAGKLTAYKGQVEKLAYRTAGYTENGTAWGACSPATTLVANNATLDDLASKKVYAALEAWISAAKSASCKFETSRFVLTDNGAGTWTAAYKEDGTGEEIGAYISQIGSTGVIITAEEQAVLRKLAYRTVGYSIDEFASEPKATVGALPWEDLSAVKYFTEANDELAAYLKVAYNMYVVKTESVAENGSLKFGNVLFDEEANIVTSGGNAASTKVTDLETANQTIADNKVTALTDILKDLNYKAATSAGASTTAPYFWMQDTREFGKTDGTASYPVVLRSLADVTVLTVAADGATIEKPNGYVLPLIQPYATSGGDATDIAGGAKIYNLQVKDASTLRATSTVNKYVVSVEKNGKVSYVTDVDASNVYAQWVFIPGTSGFYSIVNRATEQVLYTGPVSKVKDADDKVVADTYVLGADTLKLASVELSTANVYEEGDNKVKYDYTGTYYAGIGEGTAVYKSFSINPVSPFLSQLAAQFNKDSVMVLGNADEAPVWYMEKGDATPYGVKIDGLPRLKKQLYRIYTTNADDKKIYVYETTGAGENVYAVSLVGSEKMPEDLSKAANFEFRNIAEGQYQFINNAHKMTINATPAQPILEVSGVKTQKNDLFMINKSEVEKYRKLTAEDGVLGNAKIYMENEPNRYLYENTANIVANNGKGLNFLGIYNTAELTKNAALYVDTAFVERKDVYMPQYMFALGVDKVPAQDAIACTYEHNHFDNAGNKVDAAHCSHATPATMGYKSGRYLVALTDSLPENGSKKTPVLYDNAIRLAFVNAIHRAEEDSLIIKDSKWTDNNKQIVAGKKETYASNDTLKIEDNKLNMATFALLIKDQETKSFYLQNKEGFVRILNGVPVLTTKIEDAAVFNIEATTEEATANEAIEASAVQVIAGKGVVTVQGAAGKVVTVANILGQTIANQVAASDNVTIAAPAGVLVVTVDGEATKVVVK